MNILNCSYHVIRAEVENFINDNFTCGFRATKLKVVESKCTRIPTNKVFETCVQKQTENTLEFKCYTGNSEGGQFDILQTWQINYWSLLWICLKSLPFYLLQPIIKKSKEK